MGLRKIISIARAIEKDAGRKLPGLKQSLREMEAGKAARVYTPEELRRLSRQSRQDAGNNV